VNRISVIASPFWSSTSLIVCRMTKSLVVIVPEYLGLLSCFIFFFSTFCCFPSLNIDLQVVVVVVVVVASDDQ